MGSLLLLAVGATDVVDSSLAMLARTAIADAAAVPAWLKLRRIAISGQRPSLFGLER
jgi:hypothetical protein